MLLRPSLLCPRSHRIEFVLQSLGVLLNLLGLFEGFGELAEIGESNPAMVLLRERAG